MTRHTFDLGELRELETALADLVTYCQDMESHAQGASSTANAQWVGQSSVEFLTCVQTWQIGAAALREHAQDLKKWVAAAATAYEGAQSDNRTMWTG